MLSNQPQIGCAVVCLALMLAVFAIVRDLKVFFFFFCFTANEKENSESFAGILSCSWDQGTMTCIRAEGLLCMYF